MSTTKNGVFANADVDTLETVAEIEVRDNDEMFLSFVVGTADLSDFNVDVKAHVDGGYFTVAGVAADYTTPLGPVLGASGNLLVAAAGATVHWLKLNVKGAHTVRIQAAGTSSTIAGHFCAN